MMWLAVAVLLAGVVLLAWVEMRERVVRRGVGPCASR
jgi:hypothetical protein